MGSCGASCGIDRRRARLQEQAVARALRVHGDGSAGTPRWWPEKDAFAPAEVDAVAAHFGTVLPARVHVLRDDAMPFATWIYVIASTGPSSWVELRDGAAATVPTEPEQGLHRAAALQEFAFTGAPADDGVWIEERRVAGVEDRRLQPFVRAVQGVLGARRIACLDAAFLATELGPEGPSLWAALFDAAPMRSCAGVWIETPKLT